MIRWALCSIAIGLVACAPASRPLDGRSAYRTEEPVADAWLRAVMRAPDNRFGLIPSASKLPPQVRGDSVYWSERFLAERYRPLGHEPEPEIGVHAATDDTPDLIRYRYRVDRDELSVLESANVMLVSIRSKGAGELAPLVQETLVDALATRILVRKGEGHDWVWKRIGGSSHLTTAADVDPGAMKSWEERADAGVAGDAVYFFFYKKRPARYGYDNAQRWFDDEFRKNGRTW
jgi:hypothetical protein